MKKTLVSALAAAMVTVFLFTSGLIGQDQPAPEAKGGKGAFGKGKAKEPPPPAGPMPRLPDGHPDMQGYWNGPAITQINANPNAKGKGAPVIVDPVDGIIPYRPEAAAKAKQIGESRMAEEPELHCFQGGVPHQMWVQFGFQIVQDPQHVVMLWEFMHSVRIIPTDGRPHISPELKLFQGDSVGHWEGDTLVVETTNHGNKSWFDYSGNFKPETANVLERFIIVDANTITHDTSITDPATFTKPWRTNVTLRRQTGRFPDGTRDYEQMEFACLEGNRDLQHYTEDKGGKAKQVIGAKQ
jgi:hypothetical protein